MILKIAKGTKPSFETINKGKFRSRHAASSAFGYSRHTIFYHRVIKGAVSRQSSSFCLILSILALNRCQT